MILLAVGQCLPVLADIVLCCIHSNEHTVVARSMSTVVLKRSHLAVVFAGILQCAVDRAIPPYILLAARNLVEVDLHRTVGVIIHEQVVFATCCDQTLIGGQEFLQDGNGHQTILRR